MFPNSAYHVARVFQDHGACKLRAAQVVFAGRFRLRHSRSYRAELGEATCSDIGLFVEAHCKKRASLICYAVKFFGGFVAWGDRILVQAREHTIQLEKLAAMELHEQLDSYLPPSWGARRMVDAYSAYADKGVNNESDYRLMRRTFSDTQGQSHHVFSNVLASHLKSEKQNTAKTMFQGDDWPNVIKTAVRSLRMNGMWMAKFKLPEAFTESLRSKVLEQLLRIHGERAEAILENSPAAPVQIKSNYDWITTIGEMYDVASDPVLLQIVQDYLGVPPIFDTPVVMFNSTASATDKDLSDVAQLYHHDMHRLGFVKLFMYLSDVDADCGPHAAIPGTHLDRPAVLWADGRHKDEKIASHGLLEKEMRFTGPAGTLFLVDTRALHKGVHPVGGYRLMAQTQYANSLFGKPLPDATRLLKRAKGSEDPNLLAAATHVKRMAEKVGPRFMQAMI